MDTVLTDKVATNQPAPQPRSRIDALDGLRGIAVIAVIVFHAWPNALTGGFLGVDIFFVISGFVITRGIINEWEANGKFKWGHFWYRRARRILPPLLFALLGCTALAVIVGPSVTAGLRAQLLSVLTFTNNWYQTSAGVTYFGGFSHPLFQHLWSLSVEEQFYAVWPLILALLMLLPKRARLFSVAAMAVISMVLMGYGSLSGWPQDRLYFGTDTHGFALLVGAALAVVAPYIKRLKGENVYLTATVGLIFTASSLWWLNGSSALAYRGGIALVSLATAAWMAGLIKANDRPGLLSRALACGPIHWLGVRSYAAYLWHWPLLIFGWQILPGQRNVVGAAVIVLTIVASAVSWRFVEVPVRRKGFRGYFRSFAMRWRGFGVRGRYVSGIAMLLVVAATAWTIASAPKTVMAEQYVNDGAAAIASARAVALKAADKPGAARRPKQSDHPDHARATRGDGKGPAATPSASEYATGQHKSDDSGGKGGTGGRPAAPKAAPKGQRCNGAGDTCGWSTGSKGSGMTVVGDSVTLAAAPALLHRYPRAYVHADVGFQAFHAPKLVAKLLSKHQVGNVLVFALGTNGNVRARDLQAIYKMIGPDRKLVLVTNHGNLPWVKKNNNVLEKFAATHQNVRVANWNGVAHRVHDFAPDGIHPGPAGGKVWVSALNAALRG